jgi:hypothetical protein
MWVHIPKQYCPSFQELGDLTSQLNLSSHKPELWLTLSGKPTARKSSWIGCKTRPWMKELFGQILPLSMANHGVAKLICSLEDSHVKISAIVERKLESKKGQGQGYTSTTSASWTKYDQNTCSWRTFQACWITGQWALFLENWPKGGSMRNGECSARNPWVPATRGIGSLYWPTPTTQEVPHYNPILSHTGRRVSASGQSSHGLNLEDASRNWPTPCRVEIENKRKEYRSPTNAYKDGVKVQPMLADVCKNWPTPRAREIDEKVETNIARMERRKENGEDEISMNLSVTVKKWPTPVRSDFQDRKESENWDGSDLPSIANQYPTGLRVQEMNEHGQTSFNDAQNLPQRWKTPTTMDTVTNRDLENQKATRDSLGNAELSREMMGEKSRLNPLFVEWLMGKPLFWSLPMPIELNDFKHWEMESCQLLERLHSGFCLKD